jgi:superfamily I DNA and/or RNA helicase
LETIFSPLSTEEPHFQQQTSTFSPIDSLRRQLDELNGRRDLLSQRLASYPTEDFYTRYPRDYQQQQQHLFKLAWQYLQSCALQRKKEVIASLKTYIDVISSEWDYEAQRRFANNWSSILRDVSLLFPVFASTLQSVRNLLPYPDSGCIDCAVIDEAGMIPLHQAFPVLVRSRQAVVVGDPLQLEPIVSFSQQTIEQYEERAFKGRSLTNEDYERYSPTSIYTATVYHRAAGATGDLGDLGKGILLDEHYRCVPPIIEYCDRISGYHLVIKTPPSASKLGSNLIAYHVEGTIANHTNPKEVEAVERIIEHLLDKGYSLDEIGIISAYRAQADALFSHLLDRYPDFNRDRIGTVHTFQGGQKSVIILSTRQCRDADSLQFINRRPNLLNTAVSRARELFILVGNLERLRNERSYMGRLVEHIQQNGKICELP